jgi:hypothetical protein
MIKVIFELFFSLRLLSGVNNLLCRQINLFLIHHICSLHFLLLSYILIINQQKSIAIIFLDFDFEKILILNY